MFKDGYDGHRTTEELADRYGFTDYTVFEGGVGFTGTLSLETVAALRCEPAVAAISANVWVVAF